MASIVTQRLRATLPHLTRSIAHTAARNKLLDKKPDDVVITFAMRTPMGRAKKGQLKDTTVDEMLCALFKGTLERTKLNPAQIDDIIVGTCHPPSPLYIARSAALAAGIPKTVPIQTVNRLCSSGLMAIRNIVQAIQVGDTEIGFAVGVESMSLHPRPTPVLSESVDKNPESHDAIQPMGWTSEMVAETYNISREKQDHYALLSHSRAEEATKKGVFKDEILSIQIGDKTMAEDDVVRPGVTAQSLASLKPVFPDWNPATTTAGNASGMGDGAGVVVLMRRDKAASLGMQVLGKYVASTVVGVEPRLMGIGPMVAIPKILEKVGITKEDVDVYEINEAFASQFAYCVETLGIPIDKINPNGGAIAVTHPLGMTGVRQVITGLAQLRRAKETVLCTSMCVGSGMGAASIFVNEVLH